MKWIGLTGGIATGKSTVAKMLRDMGYPVIDADSLAREVTTRGGSGLAEIVREFSTNILDFEGNLDRKKVAEIVFADPDRLQKLEFILHPRIQELKNKERLELERKGHEIAFYDVPLLFEKNLDKDFDATVLVYSPVETQRDRLRERDDLTDTQIAQRLAVQIPIEDKLKRADFVIFNKSNVAELKANLTAVLNELLVKK